VTDVLTPHRGADKFAEYVRKNLYGGKLSQGQYEGVRYIGREWRSRFGDDAGDHRHLAYMLATAHHETAFTMVPVTEYGSQAYLKGKKYWPYIGRGHVQLTWDYNYKKAGEKLGLDLLGDPTLALEPDISARIMFEGMALGWFTGKKLGDYFNAHTDDPINARRIINGTDRASTIAGYHRHFLAAIKAALS
jgi:putative chitinase